MKIKDGGQLSKIKEKLKSIRVQATDGNLRLSELWINEDSLSYLTLNELLSLKDEINNALKELIK